MAPVAPIQSVPLMSVGLGTPAGGPAASATAPPADAFAGMLSQAVSGLNTQLNEAETLEKAAAAGQLPDPTVAILAIEKADISLQLATQVRNKLVEGWQEISRMGV